MVTGLPRAKCAKRCRGCRSLLGGTFESVRPDTIVRESDQSTECVNVGWARSRPRRRHERHLEPAGEQRREGKAVHTYPAEVQYEMKRERMYSKVDRMWVEVEVEVEMVARIERKEAKGKKAMRTSQHISHQLLTSSRGLLWRMMATGIFV